LDIISLEKSTRKKAKLKVLIENPSGEPKKEILSNIFDFIKNVYGTERCTILRWDDQTNPSTKIIGAENMEFLQNLWLRFAGNYLLFLPVHLMWNKLLKKMKKILLD
jgi:hypothetical protein